MFAVFVLIFAYRINETGNLYNQYELSQEMQKLVWKGLKYKIYGKIYTEIAKKSIT